MTTYTSTVYANKQAKFIHKGDVTVSGQWAASADTVTSGDVVFLAKLPHGAIIVEFAVDHSVTTSGYAVDYGLASGAASDGGASLSCLASALATATIIRKNLQFGAGTDKIQISCSASDPNHFGIFAAKLGSGTTSGVPIINFSITYRCDENQGA